MWVYFKNIGNSFLSCKLCGSEIKNMANHLKKEHSLEYRRTRQCEKTEARMSEASGSEPYVKRGWVKKYINKFNDKKHECDVCKEVISMPYGLMGNMKRHFRTKHPYIYAKENNGIFHSDGDDKMENKKEKGDAIKSIARTLTDSDEKVDRSKAVHRPRSWVRKYTTKIGVKERQCNVCKQILCLPPGYIGNMSRHFKLKHPSIYALETNQHKPDEEEEKKSTAGLMTYAFTNRNWVKRFTTKLEGKKYRCDVCQQVLRLITGYPGNMKRHFKAKHPLIYERENTMYVKSIQNVEKEEEGDVKDKEIRDIGAKQVLEEYIIEDSFKASDEEYIVEYLVEESPRNDDTSETETVTNQIEIQGLRNKGWVRKYMIKVDDDNNFQCVVCRAVLKLPNDNLNIMRRHFAEKHLYIYTRENDSENNDDDQEDNNVQSGVYVDETVLETVTESQDKDMDSILQEDFPLNI